MGLSRRYRLSDAFCKFYESLNMGHFSNERGESSHLSAQSLGVPNLEQGHLMRPPGPQRALESQDEAEIISLPTLLLEVMYVFNVHPHT